MKLFFFELYVLFTEWFLGSGTLFDNRLLSFYSRRLNPFFAVLIGLSFIRGLINEPWGNTLQGLIVIIMYLIITIIMMVMFSIVQMQRAVIRTELSRREHLQLFLLKPDSKLSTWNDQKMESLKQKLSMEGA